jgi:uncharacterized membrane protein
VRGVDDDKMVDQFAAAGGAERTFVIQPNRSMSWRHLLFAYLGISAVVLTIGLCSLAAGLPLVLPFSGLEVIALGAAFYLCAWRGGVRQVITISEERVVVEAGRRAPETRDEFQRQWAGVVLERSPNSWYPSRLYLRSHGRQVEIAVFLNEQERRGLAVELRKALCREPAGAGQSITGAGTSRGREHVA